MSEFDEILTNALMNHEKKDIAEKDKSNIVEYPVIFNTMDPEKPLKTPILSRINIEMMYDSNTEIMERKESLERIFAQLSDEQKEQFKNCKDMNEVMKLANEEKLEVKTSGQFSISGKKFVKGFMVDIASVLPECKEFASDVSEIDPAEPRYLKVVWGKGYKIQP